MATKQVKRCKCCGEKFRTSDKRKLYVDDKHGNRARQRAFLKRMRRLRRRAARIGIAV